MQREYVEVMTEEEAKAACPWARLFLAVEGGFQCFDGEEAMQAWSEEA